MAKLRHHTVSCGKMCVIESKSYNREWAGCPQGRCILTAAACGRRKQTLGSSSVAGGTAEACLGNVLEKVIVYSDIFGHSRQRVIDLPASAS